MYKNFAALSNNSQWLSSIQEQKKKNLFCIKVKAKISSHSPLQYMYSLILL